MGSVAVIENTELDKLHFPVKGWDIYMSRLVSIDVLGLYNSSETFIYLFFVLSFKQ